MFYIIVLGIHSHLGSSTEVLSFGLCLKQRDREEKVPFFSEFVSEEWPDLAVLHGCFCKQLHKNRVSGKEKYSIYYVGDCCL